MSLLEKAGVLQKIMDENNQQSEFAVMPMSTNTKCWQNYMLLWAVVTWALNNVFFCIENFSIYL